MKNEYVGFVSDQHFRKCVEKLCDKYADLGKPGVDKQRENVVDPFKLVFDTINSGMTLDVWERNDIMRSKDKAINNAVGLFHQELLGGVDGWHQAVSDTHVKIDLAKNDNSVFVELKNKHNTLNADSKERLHGKLWDISRRYKSAKCYWAHIIPRDRTSGDEVWVFNNNSNPNIRQVWGKKVYGLVTGDDDTLEEAWRALPRAIVDVVEETEMFDETENAGVYEWFKRAFGH